MTVVSQAEKLRDHQHAVAVGGAQGFLGGMGLALPASYLANRNWPYYRNLPPSLKALGVVMVVVPSFLISAENAGRRFEQDNWEKAGQDQVALIKRREETRWENMTLSQKAVDFTARHQFSVIAGCWALGIAGAFGGLCGIRAYQSLSQKVVQARMWSQGITIGVVIAAAAVSRDVGRPVNRDHSWREVIEMGSGSKTG
ncbi:hypothetical protein BGW80DRAFT_1435465 [Lactifluus volemus]|nr:hypothetical protein BGW80DRAFT_1435465 [Lactifluus volemus]